MEMRKTLERIQFSIHNKSFIVELSEWTLPSKQDFPFHIQSHLSDGKINKSLNPYCSRSKGTYLKSYKSSKRAWACVANIINQARDHSPEFCKVIDAMILTGASTCYILSAVANYKTKH